MSLEKIQQKFIQEALESHNEYRRMHNTPHLVQNQELSKLAFDWAKKIAKKQKLEHSGCKYKNENLGENLASWFKPNANNFHGSDASKQWYEEIQHFNYSKPEFNVNAGNFTQLVWNSTKEVGFGVALGSNGHFYAVAFYYPAGNILTEFRSNVLPVVVTNQPKSKPIIGNTLNDFTHETVKKPPPESDLKLKEAQEKKSTKSSGCC